MQTLLGLSRVPLHVLGKKRVTSPTNVCVEGYKLPYHRNSLNWSPLSPCTIKFVLQVITVRCCWNCVSSSWIYFRCLVSGSPLLSLTSEQPMFSLVFEHNGKELEKKGRVLSGHAHSYRRESAINFKCNAIFSSENWKTAREVTQFPLRSGWV